MVCLYLWSMLLSVFVWIIVIHFLKFPASSIYVNYTASKKMQLELYQTLVDTRVSTLHWLPAEYRSLFKTYLFTSFFILFFPKYFAPYLSS